MEQRCIDFLNSIPETKNSNQIRLLWLAPYPVDSILTSEKLVKTTSKGKAKWLVNLAEKLAENRTIQLHILTYSANIWEDHFIIHNGIYFYILRYKFPFINKGFPTYFRYDTITGYQGFTKRAVKLINEIEPDILHSHGTEGSYGLIPAILSKYPSVISIQGIISEIIKQKFDFFHLIQRKYERRCIKENKNFGCRTEWDKSIILRMNPEANIIYMPEAIDISFFNHQWKASKVNHIIFVGAILKRKGIEDLLKALVLIKEKIPEVSLTVIGKGKKSYLNKLKKFTTKTQISENVKWLGFKSTEEISGLLEAASVYVLPTYSDNSPNSLCEAMAIGIPSVAYNTGGIPSLVKHGKDGLLVETGNIGSLAVTIMKLLKNKELCDYLSGNAILTARKRNFPETVSKLTIEVYERLLSNKS